VIAGLEEIDPVGGRTIEKAMLLCDPARPHVIDVFKRLWFSNAVEGLAKNRLDQVENSQSYFSVCSDPPSEIVEEVRVKDRFAAFAAITPR